jgi:hypothetical protein
MSDVNDPDSELLAELHALLGDPMPDEVVAAASEFWTLRTLDAELEELSDLAHTPVGAAVRDGSDLVSLRFTTGDVTIEIDIDRGSRSLYVQLLPPQLARLDVEVTTGDPPPTMTSNVGVFEVRNVAPGPARVHISPATTEASSVRPTVTPWFSI